jgi:type I restriction enzyme S subunit
MGGGWQKKVFRDLCEITSSKRIYATDYQPMGVPFFRGKEIIEKQKGNLAVSTELFISKSKFLEIKNRFGAPQAGELLLTSVGTLGVPYVIKPGEEFYFKDGNLTWFRNFKNLDSRYLYYWLLSPKGKGELKKCTIGSSQSAFTIVLLKDMEIQLPPLPCQRRIASILSAYDDLIENNTRRIKILEEMAQAIYREWFVNFRFPGHEKVKMVDSPMGKIPEGWAIGKISDLVKICSGFAFKSNTFVDSSKYKIVTIKNVKDGVFIDDCDSHVDEIPRNMPEPCFLHTGDILLSLTGNVGRTCLVFGDNFLLNQRVAKLLPHTAMNRGFIYSMFRQDEMRTKLELISIGVAQQNLSPVLMGNMESVIPPDHVLVEFADFAGPICEKIISLNLQNRNLRSTRDLLLPKLISGELDVSELDIKTTDERL